MFISKLTEMSKKEQPMKLGCGGKGRMFGKQMRFRQTVPFQEVSMPEALPFPEELRTYRYFLTFR